MSEQTYRERWKWEVYRTPLLSDTVRVAMLALAEEMDEAGMVSLKRDDLAGILGKSGRRVSDRLTAGIAKGFLERVSRGQRNGAGRFRATLPGGPSSGHHAVPKSPAVLGTPCRPEENSLGDGFKHQETSALGDGMPSPREQQAPSVFGTPCRPEEPAPYRGTARAHSKHGDRHLQTPAPSGTDTPVPDETKTRVSQSARKREGIRWLGECYGLTEFEAAAVINEVTARAPREIRSLVRYMDGMKEGDLADIVAAIQARTEPAPEPEHEAGTPGRPKWCGGCDERTRQIELLDGRMARCPNCHPTKHQETA